MNFRYNHKQNMKGIKMMFRIFQNPKQQNSQATTTSLNKAKAENENKPFTRFATQKKTTKKPSKTAFIPTFG